LGQCYLISTLAGQGASYDQARSEFQAAIDAYADGANPRLRGLAAEAHARLGMIAYLTSDKPKAALEYRAAAALLYDDPERQALFEQHAVDYSK